MTDLAAAIALLLRTSDELQALALDGAEDDVPEDTDARVVWALGGVLRVQAEHIIDRAAREFADQVE